MNKREIKGFYPLKTLLKGNDLDLDLAMSVHKHFRISKSYAKDTLKDFANLISDRWNIYADDYRISSAPKERYSDAFTAAYDYADRHPSW